MVKKIKGRAAITATGTMMQKLQKDKGGGAAGGKGKDGSKKGGLSSIMSTLKMAKKKCVEEDYGGFQLLDLIITELKSHMTC